MNRWLKIIIIAVLHIAIGLYVGMICKEVQSVFPMLLDPSPGLLPAAIHILLGIGGVVLTSGLVALSIRSFPIYAVIFLFHGAAVVYGWQEFSLISIIFVFIYILLNIGFVFSTQQRMKDRIRVSLQPVNESRMMILIGIVLLICGSLYLGGKANIEKHGFHLPEELMMAFVEPFKEQALAGQPEEVRALAEEQFEEEFSQAIQQMEEEALKPIEGYIPIIIPLMIFFTMETIVSLLSFIPMMVLDIIFRILKALHFLTIEKTTGEIESLSL